MPSPSRSRPATAADVAARAGVSRATVSHVLNGREQRFPEETRQKVRHAAAELEYRPWQSGRSLVRGHSDTIAVLLPGATLGSLRLQEAVEYLTQELATSASNVVIRFADTDPRATVEGLITLDPTAVVDLGGLSRESRARLSARGIVAVPDIDHGLLSGGEQSDVVIAELQVAELVRNGTRRIVFAALDDSRRDPFGPRRVAALERATAARGLEAPVIARLPLDARRAAARIEPLVRDGPVGIAAYNDFVGLAVLAAARELGLDVPGGLSVVGVDADDLGRLWSPRLTSVDTNIRGLINAVVTQLRILLAGEQLPPGGTEAGRLTVARGEST